MKEKDSEVHYFMKRTALITGASRGIGRATAIAFARAGYDLILTCHHCTNQLETLREELVSSYNNIVTIHTLDIRDFKQIEQLFSTINHLDVLINNAGISHVGLLHEMSIESWHEVIDTNLSSAFYTCKCAIPLMLKEHNGMILNVSSVWGQVGASMEVAYSASKSGLNGFTRALAKELAPSGIAVNAVACGLIDTDMNHCFSEAELSAVIEEIPADRMASPEEVANFLLSLTQASSYMTGQIIGFDGGWI